MAGWTTVGGPDGFVHIVHPLNLCLRQERSADGAQRATERVYQRHPRASRQIARAMFETDRIPNEWFEACDTMDEIWVPSRFNRETFAACGVDRGKLVVVPESVPEEFFRDDIEPATIPGALGFVFLSVFGWSLRKGWDVLLRAYAEEFRPADRVTLVCKVSPNFGLSVREHQAEMEAFIREELGRDPAELPRIVVLGQEMDRTALAALYRAADALVLPTRGEGWGRPYLEAMAAGLPVIGTAWSGHLDFLHQENGYLIDCHLAEASEHLCREVPSYRGHRLPEPSVDHLRSCRSRGYSQRGKAAAGDRPSRGRAATRPRRRRCANWQP